MFQIDVFNLIPKALKQKAIDTTVDFIVNLGKGYLSDEITRRIKKLRSDGEFQEAFEEGLQRAANRFIEEYTSKDEDLVEAIANDKAFFKNEEVQEALLNILKKPGIYLVDEQDIVNASFDSILPDRLNRERVNQAVIFFLKCLAEEVWSLPELRPIYELQFQRMTAEAVREQVAIQKAQLQVSIAFSSDIREALLQLTDAIAEQKLLHSGDLQALPSPPKVSHNLPQPDYERFVGRKNELKQIRQLLLPYPKSRHFVITIDGIGGIGKSALALEVADSYRRHFDKLPEDERFEAIIWATAKQNILTGEGIIPRPQSFRTLEDIYNTIAVTLEREDIIRVRIDEQDNLVRQILTQQRTLLIIDNLETVDDERVMSFIRELPAPTKTIVTTRHRLDVAYPIRVTGLTEDEGLQVIADEANLKNVNIDEEQAKQLFNRTGGIPLAIVWSVAQMGFGYGIETVLTRLGQPSSDIAKFCFEGAVERIRDHSSFKLLLALSLFTSNASREALGYITDLAELDRDDGLVELEKLSLVNKSGNRFQLLPLTKVYSEAELVKAVDLEAIFQSRWVDYFLNFLQMQSKNRYENLMTVKPEMENVISIVDWCWRTNKLDTFIEFVKVVGFYLWLTGRWNTWNRYAELGLKAAHTTDSELDQAAFWRTLATLKDFQNDLDEARDFIQKAIDIYQLYEQKDRLADALWRLAAIQIKNAEYEAAKQNLNKSLVLAEEANTTRPIADIQHQLANIDVVEGNYDSAETRLNIGRQVREEDTELSGGLAYTYYSLGKVSLLKKDYKAARRYLEQCLELGQQRDSKLDIAGAKRRLAELELDLGNLEQAQQFALEAIELFLNLGMKRELKETERILEQVNTKLG
jgi:LuxR family glucitol operon transcriptional activator